MTGPDPAERELVLALGSNLGDRLGHLRNGVAALDAPDLTVIAVSSVYETDPVGGPDQPDFLNIVLLARSALAPLTVLGRCQAAERASGRERTVHWGPRTLDADLITYGDEVSDDPVLTLPHPRARERAFVLVPWLELDAAASLPGAGPVTELLAELGTAGVRRSGLRVR